ncbi:MAG: hypothetical protein JF586_17855 [Burkholderiales bacterium]|nr:hypothetical protein [Burkholderiales bacterium]
MKSRHAWIAATLPLTLALACGHAAAQDPAPTLASLALQVKALAADLKQAGALAARQQQTIDTLNSRLACVLRFSGPRDFIVDGCNLHVQNGMGQTGTLNRYGNVIIGYNKNEVSTRTGSHNLILGDLHEYTSYGGIVAGIESTLSAPNAAILGGGQNTANFNGAVILGADRGVADGNVVLIGGQRNYGSADAHFGAVVGGIENQVTGPSSVVVAGTLNVAAGGSSLVCGGSENTAGGGSDVACGGSRNTSTGHGSVLVGGNQNAVSGPNGVVTGGQHCDIGAVVDKWAVGLLTFPGGCSTIAN